MSLGKFLFGKKERVQQIPNQTPQGMSLLNQLMQQGQQNTDFGGIENMYMKKFSENIIPSIADRFASQGDERASSSLLGAMSGAGADLGSQLAALRSQYGLQQSQLGLTPQFESLLRPQTQGLLGGLAGPALKMGLGMGTGAAMGHGMFGRNAMNQYNQPNAGGFDFMQLLPLLMGGI